MADKVKMSRIALVVARSTPGHVIGRDNRLPWHLKSDLRRFKALTTGHAMVMGRKTFESIGRPLPERTTIVMSRGRAGEAPTADLLWAADLDAAVRLADRTSIERGRDRFFVVGGGEIYAMFLNLGLVDLVYLTEVVADVDGDALFPHSFLAPDWRVQAEMESPAGDGDDFASKFTIYERTGEGRPSTCGTR